MLPSMRAFIHPGHVILEPGMNIGHCSGVVQYWLRIASLTSRFTLRFFFGRRFGFY
jgi:hypothetical protein